MYVSSILVLPALNMQDKIGNFQVGKEFDAVRVSAEVEDTPYDLFLKDGFNDLLQKFFHLGE